MDKAQLDQFIRKQFTDDEWTLLMTAVHKPTLRCSHRENALKRRYWRHKKAQSRLFRRQKRFSDPQFQLWLKKRGLPRDKYRHSLWRDYVIESGRINFDENEYE